MLVQSTYKANDTVSIKITSGEEIVGRLVEETSEYVRLKKPMMVVAAGQGIGLAPYMFTSASEDMSFNKDLIVTMTATVADINTKYLETTTGLKRPASEMLDTTEATSNNDELPIQIPPSKKVNRGDGNNENILKHH